MTTTTTFKVGDKVVHKTKGKQGTLLRRTLFVGPVSRDRWYVRWSDNSETHVHRNDIRLNDPSAEN